MKVQQRVEVATDQTDGGVNVRDKCSLKKRKKFYDLRISSLI